MRGTTCHKIVKMLYESGAKEVHVRIACPEIKYPDFYGVDMPTKKSFLLTKKIIKKCVITLSKKFKIFKSRRVLYKALIG